MLRTDDVGRRSSGLALDAHSESLRTFLDEHHFTHVRTAREPEQQGRDRRGCLASKSLNEPRNDHLGNPGGIPLDDATGDMHTVHTHVEHTRCGCWVVPEGLTKCAALRDHGSTCCCGMSHGCAALADSTEAAQRLFLQA